MYKAFLIIIAVLAFNSAAFSQTSTSREGITPLEKMAIITLPELDNQLLKNYYEQGLNKPLRFAEARDIHVDLKKGGQLEEMRSGRMIWRTVIHSPGAYSLNLAFSRFRLSGDAELYIYNIDQSEVIGPFTEADNEEHLQLWTPVVPGDKIVVELQASAEHFKTTDLEISRINHDFKDILKGFQSGACNLDVACGSADGWPIVDKYRDIISSVGAYTLNGVDQCTGVLINNTAQDCKPYFLTANHCNVTNANSQSIVVYWNYENSECRQPESIESGRPGDGQRGTFNSGAIHRASLFDSDMTLIELDDPIDPTLNLFFAGWDLDRMLPDTSICIHHPNVEEKRISFEFDRLSYDPNGQDTSFVLVNDWDIGTTEPGSSGSPLFNSEKRIIGQLLGGLAACGNDEYDSYGWVRYSWEGGGSAATSLKSWLDPINLGLTAIDGRSCSYKLDASINYIELCGQETDELIIELKPSDFFGEQVDYTIISSTEGMEPLLDFIQGSRSTINRITVSGLSTIPDGRYTIEVGIDDGMNSAQARIDIQVFNAIAAVPDLSEPMNGLDNINTNVELSIKRINDVINEFQLSRTSDFAELVFSSMTESRLVELSNLDNDTEYFWRVRSSNECGISDWSEVFSFRTLPSFCTIFTSSDGPYVIEESSAPPVNSIITVPYPAVIQDVNVLNVNGTHDYVGDLRVSLNHDNLSAVLMDEICEDNMNFNLGFDDESEELDIDCPPTDGRLYQPWERLSVFDSRVAGGEWILTVEDLVSLDGGRFEEWTVELCIAEALDAAIIPEAHSFMYCRNEDIRFSVFYELATDSDEFEIRVYDRNNEQLNSDFLPRLSSINTGELVISTENLAVSPENLRVELVSFPSQAVLAITVIELIDAGERASPDLISPVDGQIINPQNFEEIAWLDVGASAYDVLVSTDLDFSQLVYEARGLKAAKLDLSSQLFDQGEYFILVVAYHDCGAVYSEPVSIILDNDTQAQDWEPTDLNIYPNPSTGIFLLSLPGINTEAVNLEMYDVSGRCQIIKVDTLNGGKWKVDASGLPDGFYILVLNSEDKTIERKLIKH